MKDTIALVLGGGRGTRLHPLTSYRSKPAVPLAGKYRLIDIPLSNCINSGINRVYVLTQFMSVSLHRHLRTTYRFDPFSNGFVEVLAAQQTLATDSHDDWYQGTADAVRKNLQYVQQSGVNYVLILSGDQLYRFDFREMLASHQECNADVSIAAIPVDRQAARSLGVMRTDDQGRVNGFLEKPQTDEEIDMVKSSTAWIESRGINCQGRDCLASMGIYLFNLQTLIDVLTKTDYQDFGKEVFPAAIRTRHVQAHPFDGYWEDIGTIRAFYDANLSLVQDDPPFRLIVDQVPTYTRARFLPPSRFNGATVQRSLIADGCIFGANVHIENSVIGVRCVVGAGATIRNSIVMGADEYDLQDIGDQTPQGIGAGSVVDGAILDKNCRIGAGVRVVSYADLADGEHGDFCVVREGIPVVVKGATIPEGWVLR